MSWEGESVWNLFQVCLTANYVPFCYECLKIKILSHRHLLSVFHTFLGYIRTIPGVLNLSSRDGTVSSVSGVMAQPGRPWIMKPPLSCAEEFNFLSIVMPYLIHLLLIFIFKGCLLLQGSFFVTSNMKHFSELSSSGSIILTKLGEYLETLNRSTRYIDIFSVYECQATIGWHFKFDW